MNNSVKNQVIELFSVHRMLKNFYLSDIYSMFTKAENVTSVKGRSYTFNQISTAFLKIRMHLI